MLNPNDDQNNLEEDEPVAKRDKIFDNKYDEIEMDSSPIEFKIDPSMEQKSYEYTLDEKLVLVKVEALISEERRFDRFLKPDESGNYKKMNKSDINDVYSYITTALQTEPRIEIFSIICSMFDVNSDKFYESLSNSFKTELITELKSRGYLKKRNTLF